MRTVEQLKAARALLGWKQADLARESSIPLDTLKRIEAKRQGSLDKIQARTLRNLQEAFERHGIVFEGTHGVRLTEKEGGSQ